MKKGIAFLMTILICTFGLAACTDYSDDVGSSELVDNGCEGNGITGDCEAVVYKIVGGACNECEIY